MSTSTATGPLGTRLTVSGVTKRFGSRTAVAPISFALIPGELVGIIGPNGAGKTTLLSILAGVSTPSAGEVIQPSGKVGWVPPAVLLLDEPSASLDPRQRERLWEFSGGLAGGGTTVVFSTHRGLARRRSS